MRKKVVFILLLCLTVSCKRPVQHPEGRIPPSASSDTEVLLNINRYLVIRQQEIIQSYTQRMGWEMQVTSTGLWYMISERGNGRKAEREMIISLDYKISLLDGTICDESEEGKPRSFRIGHGGVEPGLEEGALLLHEGDKAKFIMVPHLAHGNFGDRQKIPAGEILMYDVTVISLQ